MTKRFLRIYMNDQLAAGVAWREAARRARSNNEGTELGDVLVHVADATAEDVATFEGIMERLGLRRGAVKPRLAFVTERVGRLKLNGRLFSYSPLSRFVEPDFLALGIEGKKVLWGTLGDLAGLQGQLPDVDFDHLIARAHEQRAAIEPFRVEAGRQALGP